MTGVQTCALPILRAAGLARGGSLDNAVVVGRDHVLNVGGFSDEVFEVVARFADGTLGADHWIGQIEAIEI